MKQRRNVIILVVVLVVLVAAYLGLRFWNQRSAEAEEEAEKGEAVSLVTADDFSAMGYSEENSDGSESMSYTYKSGEWIYDADPEIALQQIEMQTIAQDIRDLTATRKLEDPDALEDYGLTEPSYTIWYTADGNTTTIYIGNEVNDSYYATIGDTGSVYLITGDILMDMHFDLIEIAELDQVPAIGSGNLLEVKITRPSVAEEDYTDEDELAELAGGFGALTLSDVADYHAKDLAAYSLDPENRITVTATYTDNDTGEENTFSVYIGASVTDSTGTERYVTVQGSDIVYLVSQSVVDNLLTPEASEAEEE